MRKSTPSPIGTILLKGMPLLIALIGGCGGGGGDEPPPPPPPAATVPAAYQALYQELETGLTNYKNTVNTAWDGTNRDVNFSTALLPAHASVGPGLLAAGYYDDVVLPYLDRLVELGADAVTIEINFPLLTAAYIGDPQPYLDFYVRLANDVRARGLKLLVEHNVLLPGFSTPDPSSYYAGLTKQRFGQERYVEVLKIVQQVRPDYLSLVTEPDTYAAGTGVSLTAVEWKIYAEGIVAQLAIDVPGYATLLGAGAGTWEAQAYVTTFAQIAGLDYIDLHVFPLASSGANFLSNLLTWPDLVRAIDASKKLVMSEGWLYKAAAAELGGAPINADFLAREVWSFWAPLDQLFLDAMARTAHYKNYELITPFWSRYFLAYLDYDDPALAGFGPYDLMNRAGIAAFAAIGAGTFTQTGRTFRALATTFLSR